MRIKYYLKFFFVMSVVALIGVVSYFTFLDFTSLNILFYPGISERVFPRELKVLFTEYLQKSILFDKKKIHFEFFTSEINQAFGGKAINLFSSEKDFFEEFNSNLLKEKIILLDFPVPESAFTNLTNLFSIGGSEEEYIEALLIYISEKSAKAVATRNTRFTVSIITNGYRTDLKMNIAERLNKAGINFLIIDFDGKAEDIERKILNFNPDINAVFLPPAQQVFLIRNLKNVKKNSILIPFYYFFEEQTLELIGEEAENIIFLTKEFFSGTGEKIGRDEYLYEFFDEMFSNIQRNQEIKYSLIFKEKNAKGDLPILEISADKTLADIKYETR